MAHTVVDGLPGPIGDLADPCGECLLNKSTRVINRQASEHAKGALDRIHSDIWGPYREPSLGGKDVYFVTFTDDYTRKTWVYVMQSRGQLRGIFTGFRTQVEHQTGRKIKIVRCDNGGEYEALERDLGYSHGILFEFTTPYTSYQNGVSERLNRALVALIRAMLAGAKLPRRLWAEALMAASYLRNRLPIGPGGKTPEEAYSGKKPSVAHLRVWGCVAYANLSMDQRSGDKLSPNAIRTALVGYMPTSKQYRLYDPVGDRVIIATSVRFVEDQNLGLLDLDDEPYEVVGFDPMEAIPQRESSIEADNTSDSQGGTLIGSVRNPRTDTLSGDFRGSARDLLRGAPHTDRAVPTTPDNPANQEAASDNSSPLRQPPGNGDYAAHRSPTATGAHRDRITVVSTILPSPALRPKPGGSSRIGQEADRPSDTVDEDDEESETADDQLRAEAEASREETPLEEEFNVRRSGRVRRLARPYEEALEALLDEGSDILQAAPAKIPVPDSYLKAMNDPKYGADWKLAIQEELSQLQSLGTWERAKLPYGKKALGCRWVFNVKYTPTGLLDRFKARLVAQGFGQVPGDDYLETFSPTIRAESLRLLLAIGAYEDMDIRQIDVVSAYPRSDLHAEVYMRPPQGLYCPEDRVLRLRKSLYGLKQSGREWYIEACKGLGQLGFQPVFSEPSIFATLDRRILIGLYVDDMLILSKESSDIDRVVRGISKRWKIKDLGEVSMILGIKVTRDRKNRRIYLDQEGYIDEVIKRFRLEKATSFTTPATTDRGQLLKGTHSEPEADQHLYQQGVGSLAWLAICTRPDIAYAWGQLSQSCSRPAVRNWNGVLRVLRYIKGTKSLRLSFGGIGGVSSPYLQGYSDSDYAGDHIDRHSVSGHIFFLNMGPVSWTSAKQRCVATSTTEAEYIALCEASKQGQWLRALLQEIGRPKLLGGRGHQVQLFGDNQASLAIAADPMSHRRTKHIDVRYHYVRQLISFGKMRVDYVPTEEMPADALTKPLALPNLSRCTKGFLVQKAL